MSEKKIYVTRSSMPPYEEYIDAIKPLWDTHLITNMGKYHKELELKLREYLRVSELALMVNGHMALELAIKSFDFEEGDEIITTPFTFVSTTHAIVRNNIKPVFCDVKLDDGTIDESKIEALITDKTVAIIPVHVYGNICNVDAIKKIADKYNLKVIYDAAHAFGINCNSEGIGSYGDASVFSFHATKVYNTIEGGAVVCSSHKMYEKLCNLKNFGIRGEELVAEVGANAKMNEFSAIMGLCNLRHIDENILRRKEKYELYKKLLDGVEGIRILKNTYADNDNYAYLPIVIEDKYGISRDVLFEIFRNNNVYVRKYFFPIIPDLECYKCLFLGNVHNARYLSKRIIVLPLFPELENKMIFYICDLIKYKYKEIKVEKE